MSLIQCDEGCRFQKDGYCRLDYLSTVNSDVGRCPYYRPILFDNRNSLSEAADAYDF